MKLTINNIGKVKCAEIEISGVTVIAGPNGSGKSTISRSLMTYATLLRRMDELVRDERVFEFIKTLVDVLELSELWMRRIKRFVNLHMDNADEFILLENWDTEEKIKNFLRAVASRSPASGQFIGQIESSEIKVHELLSQLEIINSKPDDSFIPGILDRAFGRAFKNQIVPLAETSGKCSIRITLGDGQNFALAEFNPDNNAYAYSETKRLPMPPVVYFEPIHVLDVNPPTSVYGYAGFDLNRYGAGRYGIDAVLDKADYVNDGLSLQEHEMLKDIVSELKEIVHGSFEEEDEHIGFMEAFSSTKSVLVELQNMASGSKTMSVLVHALRNGSLKSGYYLVIDEPEANLHPEWQVKFARALIILQKRLNLRLLINTHSPYFLRAIEVYMRDFGTIGQFRCYMMKPADEQNVNGMMLSLPVTDKTELVYQQLYRPFELIRG